MSVTVKAFAIVEQFIDVFLVGKKRKFIFEILISWSIVSYRKISSHSNLIINNVSFMYSFIYLIS